MTDQNQHDESYEDLNVELAKQFPRIVKHGYEMCSFNYYINTQLELAKAESAPSDSAYKNSAGVWVA